MNTIVSLLEPLEARIAPAVFLVTTTADTTDPAHDTGSLRDALALADAHPGKDVIKFHLPAPPLHGANIIELGGTELTSLGNVTIVGPGAGKLIIDGNHANRIFDINDGANATDSPATISGLSIINGNAIGGNGGGIYSTESLALKNVTISGNTAAFTAGVVVIGNSAPGTKVSISNSLITGNAGGTGGGVGLYDLKSLVISKTLVTGNTVAGFGNDGGGIYARINSTGTGMSIIGCVISGNSAGFGGGLAVLDDNTAPTSKIIISGTKIMGNTSTNGGGVLGGGGLFVGGGNTIITGSTIENNTAVYNGGGIEADGFTSLTISKCTISGNQTTKTNAQYQGGGGVFINGGGNATPQPVKVTHSKINDNQSAYSGGGIYAIKGVALTISGSTFSGNQAAADDGGGICTYGQGMDKVNLTVSSSTFSGNTAGWGGAIYAGDGNATGAAGVLSITSSKITGNGSFKGGGGGIYANGFASATIKNSVFSGNTSATYAGGLQLGFITSFQVSGGAFAGNGTETQGGGINVTNSTGSIKGVTISGNAATGTGGGVFNGGGTPGAVALQIAKVTGNTAPSAPNIYGANIMPVGHAARAPRAGHGTFVVTTIADTTDVAHDTGSLRDALALADAHPGTDTIAFALPIGDFVDGAWTIKLTSGELTSAGNVTITGPGAGKLILDGNNASRIFDINDTVSGTDSPVTISGLSIIHGKATGGVGIGSTAQNNYGGGIYSAESLTLKNVVISGNSADRNGAGVAVPGNETDTKVSISNCLLTGNAATGYAGGVDVFNLKLLTISKTTVTGNTATSNSAGGIYAGNNIDGKGITITGSLISGNTASTAGGLWVNNYGTGNTTISGTTISGNISTDTSGSYGGGGIFVKKGNTVITGSTIENNTAVYYGGGIEANGFTSLTISKSTISGNRTTNTNARYQGGGGLFIDGTVSSTPQSVKITNSQITDNRSARYGGGVFAYNGQDGLTLTISNSNFSGNTAGSGAGIAIDGFHASALNATVTGGTFSGNNEEAIFASFANLSVTGSKVTGNTAERGAGIYAEDMTSLTINKVMATGNTAHYSGGAEYIKNTSNFTISGGSLTGNAASVGGGLFAYLASGTITGVTISGNAAGTAGGGVFNGGLTPGNIMLQIAKVIANTAPTGPNVADTPGDLSTFMFV